MTVRNNTVAFGSASVAVGIGSWASTTSAPMTPIIDNNIVFGRHHTSSNFSGLGTCVFAQYDEHLPSSLKNNNLFDCPAGLFFVAETSTVWSDSNNATWASGNVAVDLLDGTDTSFVNETADVNASADWRLKNSAPTSIRQGGLDGAAQNFVFGDDYNGTPRTAPWSIGAYENDSP